MVSEPYKGMSTQSLRYEDESQPAGQLYVLYPGGRQLFEAM